LQPHRILIIGTVWVAPNSSAAGSRMLQLIHLFLAQNYKITFACTAIKPENATDLSLLGIEEVQITLNHASFDDFVKKLNPTIVLFDRFMTEEQFGWRITENCPKAFRILDTEDLHSLRKTRHKAIKKGIDFSLNNLLQSDIAKREIASILRCDVSLIISTFEMEVLQNVFKIDKKLLYYLPFLFTKIDEKHIQNWIPFEDRNHFIFIGNFFHKPNVDTVLQLKKSIWKNIRKKLPKAELHIYGAYATQQILQLHNKKEGFLVKGFAEDAQKVVQNAKIELAPLRFGAGIKGKLTEAMICGTPSVTTTIGAEGMHADLPWNGFITDDFTGFSQKAIDLYTQKSVWEKAQKNGIQIINQWYDKEKLSDSFLHKIEELYLQLENHRIQNFMGSLLQHQTLQATKYMSKWIECKNKTSS